MRTLFIFLVFLVLLIPSCKHQSKEQISPDITTVFPLKYSTEINDFSSYIKKISYVKLSFETGLGVYRVKKILRTSKGEFLVKSHRNLSLFDEYGNYLISYGSKGKGPGEYIEIRDFYISGNEEEINILDPFENILVYRVSDGVYQRTVKPNWNINAPTADYICPSRNRGFFLFRPQTGKDSNFSNDFYCLTEFDSNGNIREEYMKRNDFIFNLSVFSQGEANSYFIRPIEGSEMLLQINNGVLKERLRVTFEDKSIPKKHIFSYGKNPWEHISDYVSSPYYKFMLNFSETEKQLYFLCLNSTGKEESYVISKNTQNGIRWVNKSQGPSLKMFNSANNCFMTYLEESEQYGNDEVNIDPFKKFLIEQLPLGIDPERNPVLVFIEFNIQ